MLYRLFHFADKAITPNLIFLANVHIADIRGHKLARPDEQADFAYVIDDNGRKVGYCSPDYMRAMNRAKKLAFRVYDHLVDNLPFDDLEGTDFDFVTKAVKNYRVRLGGRGYDREVVLDETIALVRSMGLGPTA